jgi:hypothetical protein
MRRFQKSESNFLYEFHVAFNSEGGVEVMLRGGAQCRRSCPFRDGVNAVYRLQLAARLQDSARRWNWLHILPTSYGMVLPLALVVRTTRLLTFISH